MSELTYPYTSTMPSIYVCISSGFILLAPTLSLVSVISTLERLKGTLGTRFQGHQSRRQTIYSTLSCEAAMQHHASLMVAQCFTYGGIRKDAGPFTLSGFVRAPSQSLKSVKLLFEMWRFRIRTWRRAHPQQNPIQRLFS